jgi:hypothetical protein
MDFHERPTFIELTCTKLNTYQVHITLLSLHISIFQRKNHLSNLKAVTVT